MINGTLKSITVNESTGYRTHPEGRANQHTLSLLVNNKPGVLIRIAMVFSRRGYNIDSLVVSPAYNGRFARMNIMASGDIGTLEQIIRQLNKLIDVIHAKDHTGENAVVKELALIKVKCPPERRTEVLQIAEHFKGQTADISDATLMLQVTGSTEKLDALEAMLDKYGLIEVVRTGKVIMARGEVGT